MASNLIATGASKPTVTTWQLDDLAALTRWMAVCAPLCFQASIHCIALTGAMGSGKTTWVQHFLSACGYTEPVQSPTYNLLQTHTFNNKTVHHFDLYRLDDPDDCTRIGLRDLCAEADCVLIEWPEKAGRHLPKIDLTVHIASQGGQHVYELRGPDRLLGLLAEKTMSL